MNFKKLGLLVIIKKILIFLILYGLDLIIRWKLLNDFFFVFFIVYGELLGKVYIFFFLISFIFVFSVKMVFCIFFELGVVFLYYKLLDVVVDLCVIVFVKF